MLPNIGGIIGVAAQDQGAPLADNAVAAVNFLADVQRRVNDGLTAANVPFEIVRLFTTPAPGVHAFFATLASLVLWKTAGQQIDLGNLPDIPNVPALPDLSPSSSAMQMLNQRTDDAAIPRAHLTHRHLTHRAGHKSSAALRDGAETITGEVSHV